MPYVVVKQLSEHCRSAHLTSREPLVINATLAHTNVSRILDIMQLQSTLLEEQVGDV
jgi:hypothetical protein